MSQQNKNNDQPVRIPSEEVFKQMLSNEARKLDISEKRLALEREQQRLQYEFAIKSLDANKELLKDEPSQRRKTYITIASAGIIIFGIFIWFVMYCLDHGKETFVLDLIKAIGWLISLFLSYFAGKKIGQTEKPKELSQNNDPN